MIRREPWCLGVALLTGALLLSACDTPAKTGAAVGTSGSVVASSATSTTLPALVPSSNGTAHVAVQSVPTTLNPYTALGADPTVQAVASLIWPQVFALPPALVPTLDTKVIDSAELVSVTPQTIVYQIDQSAKWSDGTPVTAADFTYLWNAQRGGALDTGGLADSVRSTAGYDDIGSVTGSNSGRTVTVVFDQPYADWESLFADLLPAELATATGWNTGFNQLNSLTAMSGGPYQVKSWNPGVTITLQRNPHWWGDPPPVETIVITAPPSTSVGGLLRTHQVDLASPPSFDPPLLAQVTGDPALQSHMGGGTTSLQLAFNQHQPLLAPASARQGIAQSISRQHVVGSVFGLTDPNLPVDSNHLFTNSQSWYADNGGPYRHVDLTAAAKLLVQSGLHQDSSGTWIAPGGSDAVLNLTWASDNPWASAAGVAIAGQLVTAGFDVNENPVSTANLLANVLPGGNYEIAVVPVQSSAYPSITTSQFVSTMAVASEGIPTGHPGAGGGGVEGSGSATGAGKSTGSTAGATMVQPLLSLWTGSSDPAVDSLFIQAEQQLNPVLAQPAYEQLDAELWTQMVTLPLFAEPTLVVNNDHLPNIGGSSGTGDDVGVGDLMWQADVWEMLNPPATPAKQRATG